MYDISIYLHPTQPARRSECNRYQ